MICPKCFGVRYVPPDPIEGVIYDTALICDYCKGQGIIHCCEGDGEQPDESEHQE